MSLSRKIILISLLTVIPMHLSAYMMGSGSYRVSSDSVNFGGGTASSASYNTDSTLGEIGTGESASASYNMHAGYQQMHDSYISISSPSDSALALNINGVSGGVATGSTTWKVITDNEAGYTLSIRASTNPALKSSGGASFADYAPAGADPDFAYTYALTESRFGFTPEGVDTAARFKDNGATCNSGSLQTSDRCWDGLTTSDAVVAESSGSNHPDGATTTMKYQAAVGASKIQDSGSYAATITVTATTL